MTRFIITFLTTLCLSVAGFGWTQQQRDPAQQEKKSQDTTTKDQQDKRTQTTTPQGTTDTAKSQIVTGTIASAMLVVKDAQGAEHHVMIDPSTVLRSTVDLSAALRDNPAGLGITGTNITVELGSTASGRTTMDHMGMRGQMRVAKMVTVNALEQKSTTPQPTTRQPNN